MSIIKHILVEIVSLFLLSSLISSFIVFGGAPTFILGGIVLYLLSKVLKPILKFITAPFYILTFGLISILINAFILFLLTKIISGIIVKPFSWNGFSLNLFEAFLIVAALQLVIKWFILWIASE